MQEAGIAACVVVLLPYETDSNIPSATRTLHAIATLAKQKQLVLSMRYFGFNTLVDSILFWPHFMEEIALMWRLASQASISKETKVSTPIALDYKYCIMVRPMYMLSYLWLVGF